MIISTITASNCTPQTIVIGRRGTYDTMQIAFDLSFLTENYGSGTAVLAVKRSQDESAYPAVVTQEDNILTWTVSETDTAYVGSGECQLMWYVDGGLAKTIIYPMVVMRDILSTAEEPPDGYENWIEHLTDLGAETQQNAQNAAQSASEAEQAKDDAVDAKEASEEAARKAAEASVHAPIIQNGYWYIWNDGQYVDTGVRAEGQKGDKGDTGEKGDTGNGIESITKTGTSGLVDTYTVTYTDGTTTTFTVTNGAKGDKGDAGATGNGIQSITKTGTSGNVDTYTITYTNGQTTTFTVTNGAVTSVAGKTGAVVLDSGDIGYDSTETYTSGTAGAALSDLTRQISDSTTGLDTKAPVILETASGAIASFDDGADSMPIRKIVATIEPVQAGSGVPSPDNERPISGWTGAHVSSNNKNLYKTEKTVTHRGLTYITDGKGHLDINGTYSGGAAMAAAVGNAQTANYQSGITLANEMLLKPGTYTIKATRTGASFLLYALIGPTLGVGYNEAHFRFDALTGGTFTITTPEYLSLYTTASELTAQSYTVHYDIQLETGDHATTFEEREYASLPINWETEAGTVYGGAVTLNEDGSADLVSTHRKHKLTSVSFTHTGTHGQTYEYRAIVSNTTDILGSQDGTLCDCLATSGGSVPNYAPYSYAIWKATETNNINLYCSFPTTVSVSEANDLINGLQPEFILKLRIPISYHFSNLEQLKTFLGENNVWCDTGDITELVYPVDTTAAIDAGDAENASAISTLSGSLATVETTSTASKAYAVDDLLVYNNQLYKVASAIAAGGTLTVGTNIVATTVESELEGKQDAPATAGTAGQVLSLSSDLVPTWVNKSDLWGLREEILTTLFPSAYRNSTINGTIITQYSNRIVARYGSESTGTYQAYTISATVWRRIQGSITASAFNTNDLQTIPAAWKNPNINIYLVMSTVLSDGSHNFRLMTVYENSEGVISGTNTSNYTGAAQYETINLSELFRANKKIGFVYQMMARNSTGYRNTYFDVIIERVTT